MFVDEVTITVRSGKGGQGCISFRREKYVPKGGPDGGNGGKGGDVVIRANDQLQTLLDHRYRRFYKASDGHAGSSSKKAGKWGDDLVIDVPCGTVIRDSVTNEIIADLVESGSEIVVAKGGSGGRGNSEFATATQQAPRYAEPGEDGQERELSLELKLIADIGLVGLPNAGKSTLLSVISAARPRIADYPFTTLEPNLGIVRYRDSVTFTVADIPGLVEGAHLGKGLGIQFLKHIERTTAIVILIECVSSDFEHDLVVLQTELRQHSRELGKKPYIIGLSKADTVDGSIRDRIEAFMKIHDSVIPFSSISKEGLDDLLRAMWSLITASRKA